MADILEYRDKMIKELEKGTLCGGEDGASVEIQYCYALHAWGPIAANYVLHKSPKEVATVLDCVAKGSQDEKRSEKGRLLKSYENGELDDFSRSRSRPHLRGGRHPADDPLDEAIIRRLGDDDKKDEVDDNKDADEDHSEKTESLAKQGTKIIMEWSDHEWEEFIKQAKHDGITEHTFAHKPQIPCDMPPLSTVVPVLGLMHELELVRAMMHTYTGTFVVMVLVLVFCGSSYLLYWELVMKTNQRRLRLLEPGFLWIFLLDWALIGFMTKASKMYTTKCFVTFFFYKPSRMVVKTFCAVGIVLYPVGFVILSFTLTFLYTRKPWGSSEPHMVFDSKRGVWIDPEARELKITLDPPIPKYIPILPALMTSHARACIPVLNSDGEPISFKLGLGNQKKKRSPVDQAKLDQDEKELEDELRQEIEQLETDTENKARKQKMEALEKEQRETAAKQERNAKHEKTMIEHLNNLPTTDEQTLKLPSWFPTDEQKQKGEEIRPVQIKKLMLGWTSQKNRKDNETLAEEEQFALLQYLEVKSRHEQRLAKYNILQVRERDGYLLPKEPFKNNDQWWLTEQERKQEADGKVCDQLHQYKRGKHGEWSNFIEDALGNRLVYPGDEHNWFGFRWCKLGGGVPAAHLKWMPEPEEGWDLWEIKNIRGIEGSKADPSSTAKYADKWQWIYMEQWKLPWTADDASERSIPLLCGCKIEKASIPLYQEFRDFVMGTYKDLVPGTIAPQERDEIRKHVWREMLGFMTIKMKFSWCAAKHPKFHKGDDVDIVRLCETDFSKVLVDVLHAKPIPEQLVGVEKAAEHELLAFSIMKLEDLYKDSEEPWWEECDPPAAGEFKVTLDHSVFFKDGTDEELARRRTDNNLVPPHGYCTSPLFMMHPNDTVGTKRFVLTKPDGSVSRTEMNVQMKHILPLMRYTRQLKINVDIDSFDLPYRSTLAIILGSAGYGEEYNYSIDRMTTLISIGVLASKPDGPACACAFLIVRAIAFLNRWVSSYRAGNRAFWAAEAANAQQTDKGASGEKEPLLPKPTTDAQVKGRTATQAFWEVEVTVLFFQVATLGTLSVTQWLPKLLPPPLCSILCILICCFSMLYMNAATARKELEKVIEHFSSSLTTIYRQTVTIRYRARNWLNGENPFDYQFISFDTKDGADKHEVSVKEVHFVVPELGLTVKGKTDVNELLSAEEVRRQQLQKQVAYYVHQKRFEEDPLPTSVRELARFEGDIQGTFSVALDVDQFKMCKHIPPVMATLQCVNHCDSPISRPDFDSFLTLFMPIEWSEEDEANENAVNELLSRWKAQVAEWMTDVLGAVPGNDRAVTQRIQEHIASLLEHPFKGKMKRSCVYMRIDNILLPHLANDSGCKLSDEELEGKLVFVTVHYEGGDLQTEFPTDRMSACGKLTKFDPESAETFIGHVADEEEDYDDEDGQRSKQKMERMGWQVKVEDEFKVYIPPSVNKIRLMVWCQSSKGNDVSDHLLAITKDFDILADSLSSEKPDKIRVSGYIRWQLGSKGRDIKPIQVTTQEVEHVAKSCWQRIKQAYNRHTQPTVTTDDVELSKGFIDLAVRALKDKEKDTDLAAMLEMQDVVGGTSAMNREKLARHTDRHLQLADICGLYVDDSAMRTYAEHLRKLKVIRKETTTGSKIHLTQNDTKLGEYLVSEGCRRALGDQELMKRTIEKMEKGILAQKERHEKLVREGRMPTRSYDVTYRQIGYRRTPLADTGFEGALLAKLLEYQHSVQLSGKTILHYVMISDHLKPSKIWRPDAISPHVASLVAMEGDDIECVKVAGSVFGDGVDFKRENMPGSRDVPALIHGRLCFRAIRTNEWMQGVWADKHVYLYWDGLNRWVISSNRGEPAPYGLRSDSGGDGPSQFMWVADHAVTPDKIKSTWKVWAEKKQDRSLESPESAENPESAETEDERKTAVFEWQQEKSIRVSATTTVRVPRDQKALDLLAKASGVKDESETVPIEEQPKADGILSELLKSLMLLMQGAPGKKATPGMQECLLSLQGNNLNFAWKNPQQEALTKLRQFLLANFGSYQSAWVHLCRKTTIRRDRCVKNLQKILTNASAELRAADAHAQYEKARTEAMRKEKMMRATARRSGSQLGEGEGDEPGQLPEALIEAAEGCENDEEEPMPLPDRKMHVSGRESLSSKQLTTELMDQYERFLKPFLEKLEENSDYIISKLDINDDGQIVVQEIQGLYMSEHTDPQMNALRSFLLFHPQYCEYEVFWTELSDGFELTLQEFADSAKTVLARFETREADAGQMTPEQKAKTVFSKFDTMMNGGISFDELRPAAGLTWEAAEQNLVQVSLPLDFIKEVRVEAAKGKGSNDQTKVLKLLVNSQFETSAEWKALKKGLNPNWDVKPGFESLQIVLPPAYLDMWKQVILDCRMSSAQEFIRFYDGATAGHFHLPGLNMREGQGIQRWPDGRTYNGQWRNHQYHGEGRLYTTHDDMLANRTPIYAGGWERGKRHGYGVFRWQQDTLDKAHTLSERHLVASVAKVYEGQFKDDLFFGRGTLRLEKAVPHVLPGALLPGDGDVPYPSQDASQLVHFEGQFASRWEDADELSREEGSIYLRDAHPEKKKDLELEEIPLKAKKRREPVFLRYFDSDATCQLHGAQLPDLALAYYVNKCAEAVHMTVGKGHYADLSTYEGTFVNGKQHGQGKVEQFERLKNGLPGRRLASYEGGFAEGKFHGSGIYQTDDGLKYEGSYEEGFRHGKGLQEVSAPLSDALDYTRYEGDFKDDLFDGVGVLEFGHGGYIYEGEFRHGTRHGIGKVYRKLDAVFEPAPALEDEVNQADTPAGDGEANGEAVPAPAGDGEANEEAAPAPAPVSDDEDERREKAMNRELVLHGPFADDKVHTTPSNMAWVRFKTPNGCRFFHGLLQKDGDIGTYGTLYREEASKVKAFMKAFRNNRAYTIEDVNKPASLRLTIYSGNWKDNKPHGSGVQHFEGDKKTKAHRGTYIGQFKDGKRHGRGRWEMRGWMYRPIVQENVNNWYEDMMHGIAIIEDEGHVHENVIYSKGKCQMPFTEKGPPLSGFDSTGLKDVMPKRHPIRQFVLPLASTGNPEDMALAIKDNVEDRKTEGSNSPDAEEPDESVGAERSGMTNATSNYTNNTKAIGVHTITRAVDKVWDPEEINGHKTLALMSPRTVTPAHNGPRGNATRSQTNNTFSLGPFTSSYFSQKVLDVTHSIVPGDASGIQRIEEAPSTLVREPTDLTLPEEDVIIKGGTGLNAVLNGVYFKLNSTFGVKAFKMVKTLPSGERVVRYLYRDSGTNSWTIAPKSLQKLRVAPGYAFNHDDQAEHPAAVCTPWFVWHPTTGTLKAYGDNQNSDTQALMSRFFGKVPKISGIDQLVSKSVAGYDCNIHPGFMIPGLMLRISQTLYGRPAYEVESGGQFLYFMKSDEIDEETGEITKAASVEEAMDRRWEDFGAGVEPDVDKLFELTLNRKDDEGTTERKLGVGYWAVAIELGAKKDQHTCIAYCMSLAITPDDIDGTWNVKTGNEWEEAPGLKFKAREWARDRLLDPGHQ
eukprot:TRINITY_DN2597_c0_g4_i2.p1 TRINITY_DN2597_c0_g4~~TRINITY_DN2597_c0_g4_i2.p1  ORF type:complete len:4129 (+),score=689.20 TRINITY_DN2597_c0_g4_i2:1820-12388(+)